MYTAAAPPEGFTWGYDTRSTTETYEQYLQAKAREEAAPKKEQAGGVLKKAAGVLKKAADTVLKKAAPPAAAATTALTVGQACTFMYANDEATIEEKAAYLKGKGVSDFVIAQSTCCSMLDRFGPVLDCEPAAAAPAAAESELTVGQACTFMYANDEATIEEKAAYLKGKGVSDFVIAQSTCCSMLDRFGPVLDCEPAAAAPAAAESELTVGQACTFMYANDEATIEEKAAYLKGKGVSDFVIAQSTCCSMLDRFGPVLDCEPAAAAPAAAESELTVGQACTFMYANDEATIEEKAAYLKGKGVSDFVIAQSTCCSMLDRFGPVLDCEPAAAAPAAAESELTVGQACTFMYANDEATIEEKAAYLKGKGVSDFVIAQSTCCSMLDRFGPVLDCEPAAAAPAAAESELTVEQACTFMYANDEATIEEKAAYLKGKGVLDFVIAQSTCCSMLDRFGPVLDGE